MEADNSGRVIPHEAVDMEYDSACKKIKEAESSLTKHLKEQRKLLGDASVRTFLCTLAFSKFSFCLLCLYPEKLTKFCVSMIC